MKVITAFDYMLRGLAITISKDLRATVRGSDIGERFYITAINDNQKVNLKAVGSNLWDFENIDLNDIIF